MRFNVKKFKTSVPQLQFLLHTILASEWQKSYNTQKSKAAILENEQKRKKLLV